MDRLVEPELLDEMPPTDLRAVRSRQDLKRINALMGNARLLAHLITSNVTTPPRKVLEIGSGDGLQMLDLSRRLSRTWQTPVEILLLDREPCVAQVTLSAFTKLGWTAQVVKQDSFDWLKAKAPIDLVIANLFLHHFSNQHLRELFAALASVTQTFVSCDPRRWRLAAIATKFLWMIGCNDVTQHDAIASVRAGFCDRELSTLWPPNSGFKLLERPGSYASHLFLATRFQ